MSSVEYFVLDGGVMVLNLWIQDVQTDEPFIGNGDPYRKRAQSQLIDAPEPGFLILLGIGLSNKGLLARRKKQTV